MMNGNPISGSSRVASTGPCVGHRPDCVWMMACLLCDICARSALACERQPAELAESDQQARRSPGRHDQQVLTSEPQAGSVRVVSHEQSVREVPDGEDLA